MYAVIASVLGIFLGKYITISYVLVNSFNTTYMSPEIWTAYKEMIFSTLEPMDYLFFVLAIVTAWQMTKSTAKKANKAEESASEPSVPQ